MSKVLNFIALKIKPVIFSKRKGHILELEQIIKFIKDFSVKYDFPIDFKYFEYRLKKWKSSILWHYSDLVRGINNYKNESDNFARLEQVEFIKTTVNTMIDKSSDDPTENKEAAVRWLELSAISSRNADCTDKKGRIILSKQVEDEKRDKEYIEKTKEILLNNPDITPPPDIHLGIMNLTPVNAACYMEKAILYIKNGWDLTWEKCSTSKATNSTSSQKHFDRHFNSYSEAMLWAKKNPGKIIVRCENGYTEKKKL